jgi:hypothetical protein
MIATRPLSADEQTRLNEVVRDRTAQLALDARPERLEVAEIRLARSSLSFIDPARPWRRDWSARVEEPLASVQRIAFRDTGRGALQGLGIGALAGSVAGAVAGFAIPWSCDTDCRGVFLPLTVVGGAVGFGLIGAITGAVIGAPVTIEFRDELR